MPDLGRPFSLRDAPSIRQLRAFVAVYHSGQVSAAARQLALTQPAVTVLLRELEERLRIKLFDRSTRVLRRTDAASEAIGYAERALAELEALGASMANLAGANRGRVRIAATSTVAQTLLPSLMRSFLDAHPEVQLELEDVAPAEFIETLLRDRVDLGIGTLEGSRVSGLREHVFLQDCIAAVGLASPAFAADTAITWKQLAALPLISVKPGYGFRRLVDEAAESAGVKLRFVYEVSLLITAVSLAASGLGVAVIPSSIAGYGGHTGLVARKLTRPTVDRYTAVVHRSDRSLSPTARAFADLAMGSSGGR